MTSKGRKWNREKLLVADSRHIDSFAETCRQWVDTLWSETFSPTGKPNHADANTKENTR